MKHKIVEATYTCSEYTGFGFDLPFMTAEFKEVLGNAAFGKVVQKKLKLFFEDRGLRDYCPQVRDVSKWDCETLNTGQLELTYTKSHPDRSNISFHFQIIVEPT